MQNRAYLAVVCTFLFLQVLISASAISPKLAPDEYLIFNGKKVPLIRQKDQIGIPKGSAIREVGPVYFDPESKRTLVCTDRILLRVASPNILQEVLKAYPVELLENLKLPRTYCLKAQYGTLEVSNRIAQHPGVEWAEPEFLGQIEPTRIPNDPMYPQAWHLNGKGDRGLMANLAWDIGWGDEKIVVGVFDDGGDPNGHPDLNLSPSGMNWTTTPYSKPPWKINSGYAHGTACAGAVGAIGDNNIGVVGVAPGVTILPMKVTNYPESGFAWDRSMGDAILYAADSAQVGTVSIVGFGSNYVRDAIKEAAINGRKGKGFLFFTSSGNSGANALSTPSLYEYSICVGASTASDQKASYSQWGATGKTVEFLAPSGVPTTILDGNGPSYVSSFGGTSAATPVAAGVAALILSTNPDLTRKQVLAIMRSTCDKIGGVTYNADGIHPQYGHGRLNAFAALQKVPPYIVLEPRDTTIDLGLNFNTSITARGFEMTYQWQKQVSGSKWQTLSGETNTVYALNSFSAAQVGRYRFIVKNANGSDTSRAFAINSSGRLSVKRLFHPGSLEMHITKESGRIRCEIHIPTSGLARLEILSPNGKGRFLLNQKMGAGVYTIHYPYRQVYSEPYLYRLSQGANVKTGRFQ
jgi:thermitase